MPEYSIVGKRTPREEAVPKATGEAMFGIDLVFPGMLHGAMLCSPHPHARILNIDTTRASRLPGVRAVITGNDLPDRCITSALGPPLAGDRHFLPRDKVRYLGEALAAVAAIDEETAEEALGLIQVEYEPLPAVFDPVDAMRPGAVKIHDNVEQNIPVTSSSEYGDVEKGFEQSDYVREDTFKLHLAAYGHAEPQNCIAGYDPISGKLTMWASVQGPHMLQKQMANLLDIPWSRIRVVAPFVGGGFGGRGATCTPLHVATAALSMRAGRPVKIVHTREQEFTLMWMARHSAIVTLKTGVKRDGTLMAREATVVYDCGAYKLAVKGPIPQAYVAGLHMPYRIPNFRAKGIAVYTNKQPVGPFRGYGQYPTVWAAELQMDIIARELGIDPLELRIANAVQPHRATPLDWQIATCGLTECIQKAGEAIGWKEQRGRLPNGRGKGVSASWFSSDPAGGTPEHPIVAEVRVNADGVAELLIVGTDSGSGQYSTLCMIAAEELGIALENVKRRVADTDLFPNELGGLSVTVSSFGVPVRIAAQEARQAILEVVANKLEASPQDLEARNGRVYVKGSPESGMTFAEAARIAVGEKGPIIGRGKSLQAGYEKWGAKGMAERFVKYSHPGTATGFSFGAASAEVEVDRDTGGIRVLRVAHAYDVGFAVNPLGVEGQLQGGAGMGIGGLVLEELLYDEGQILNPSYLNYRMLTALDAPPIIPIIVEENDPRDGPYGAKELGMGALCAAGSAVVNAIYDATGVVVREFPVTPERIQAALEAQKDRNTDSSRFCR